MAKYLIFLAVIPVVLYSGGGLLAGFLWLLAWGVAWSSWVESGPLRLKLLVSLKKSIVAGRKLRM